MIFLQIALGGAFGAMIRYCFILYFKTPLATILINIIGIFIIGLAFVGLGYWGLQRWQPLVITGLLGGFTTFSAFSLDTWQLVENGAYMAASGYVMFTLIGSFLAVIGAVVLMRSLLT